MALLSALVLLLGRFSGMVEGSGGDPDPATERLPSSPEMAGPGEFLSHFSDTVYHCLGLPHKGPCWVV